MKTEKIEELIVKWVDHRLNDEETKELDQAIEQDESLRSQLDEMVRLKVSIQSEIPASVDPPYPDFFNSQLMRKIDLDIAAQKPKEKVKRCWHDLRWAWAPSAALSLVLAFLAGKRMSDPVMAPDFVNTSLPSVYFSEENLAAEVISDADGDVSAILVSGLSELDDRGSFATRAEVEPSSQIEELPVSYQLYEAAHFH
ncbi:MAG: anti-sigma factor family protein [Akkermansiaceae bacterium]